LGSTARIPLLGGKIRYYVSNAPTPCADLAHFDGVLRVLAADLDPETIRPKRRYQINRYFGRNEPPRFCMDTLRLAEGQPLTTDRIVAQIMTAKGFDVGDHILRTAIAKQIRTVLRGLRNRGTVHQIGFGRTTKWKLAGI
jgi:hypothetical protein